MLAREPGPEIIRGGGRHFEPQGFVLGRRDDGRIAGELEGQCGCEYRMMGGVVCRSLRLGKEHEGLCRCLALINVCQCGYYSILSAWVLSETAEGVRAASSRLCRLDTRLRLTFIIRPNLRKGFSYH